MPRIGFITPSKFVDLMTDGKEGKLFGVTAYGYAEEIAMNLVYRVEKRQVTAPSLNFGNEFENMAIAAYETDQMVEVVQPGFQIGYDLIGIDGKPYVGGTPDGHVGIYGGVDTKCPWNDVNHYKNIKDGFQLKKYVYQFQGYMWITGRKWWDLASYNPDFPEFARLATYRMERDDVLIRKMRARVEAFYWSVLLPEVAEAKRVALERWGVDLTKNPIID